MFLFSYSPTASLWFMNTIFADVSHSEFLFGNSKSDISCQEDGDMLGVWVCVYINSFPSIYIILIISRIHLFLLGEEVYGRLFSFISCWIFQ